MESDSFKPGDQGFDDAYKVNAWIQTYSGKTFHLLEPQEDDIDITDIAHALANQCRFTGHVKKFYSVAQHSVMVADILRTEKLQFWGLLHDASEAYISDLSRPLKHGTNLGTIYRQIEEKIMSVIASKFGLSWPEPPEVKMADTILLLTEQRDLLGRQAKPWVDKAAPLPFHIQAWGPEEAEHRFLDAFYGETSWKD